MPAIPVEILPAPPADTSNADSDTRIEFVPDLDTVVEHSMCSCNAGDDNPY